MAPCKNQGVVINGFSGMRHHYRGFYSFTRLSHVPRNKLSVMLCEARVPKWNIPAFYISYYLNYSLCNEFIILITLSINKYDVSSSLNYRFSFFPQNDVTRVRLCYYLHLATLSLFFIIKYFIQIIAYIKRI